MIDDDDDDPTTFEPMPWGARQRVAPRRTFRAALSQVIAPAPVSAPASVLAPAVPVAVLAPILAPAIPARPPMHVEQTWPVMRQRDLREILMPFAAPVGAALVVLALALGYHAARGVRARPPVTTSAYAPTGIVAEPIAAPELAAPSALEPILLEPTVATAAVDTSALEIEILDDEQARPASAKPSRRQASSHTRRPRRIVAGDTSSPLGSLRPRKSW
jgi:hypothetical protein